MGMIWIAGAALWGIAEATIFFIVPDVLLTLAALRFGWKKGLLLSAIAALSAAIAGMGMWQWGREDIATAQFAMLLVPAVDTDLLQRATREMGAGWPLHLVTGAMTGVPYKLYAVEAGARGIDILSFAAISFAARFSRFPLPSCLRPPAAAWHAPSIIRDGSIPAGLRSGLPSTSCTLPFAPRPDAHAWNDKLCRPEGTHPDASFL